MARVTTASASSHSSGVFSHGDGWPTTSSRASRESGIECCASTSKLVMTVGAAAAAAVAAAITATVVMAGRGHSSAVALVPVLLAAVGSASAVAGSGCDGNIPVLFVSSGSDVDDTDDVDAESAELGVCAAAAAAGAVSVAGTRDWPILVHVHASTACASSVRCTTLLAWTYGRIN